MTSFIYEAKVISLVVFAFCCISVVLLVYFFVKKSKKRDFEQSLDTVPEDPENVVSISSENITLTEAPKKSQALDKTSLFVDIVTNNKVFRIERKRLRHYVIPRGDSQVLLFISLEPEDTFQKRVWYYVEEQDGTLFVRGAADKMYPGLIQAFELVGYIGKHPGYILKPHEKVLLKNVGWGIEEVSHYDSFKMPSK